MKKLLVALIFAFCGLASAVSPGDFIANQINVDGFTTTPKVISQPPSSGNGVFYYPGATQVAYFVTLDPASFSVASGILSTIGNTASWSTLTGKPSWTGVFDGSYSSLTSKPSLFSGAWVDLTSKCTTVSGCAISDAVTTTQLATKLDIPSGTTSQYVRGDGSLGTSLPAFSYGFPFTRTLAQSTSLQATDAAKPAVLTISPACTNSTTLLAASACTLQVRVHTSAVTCSTGTVYANWTSTYTLGLLLTNASGSPFDVKLPTGAFFILCPVAGTFTIAAAEQTVGN